MDHVGSGRRGEKQPVNGAWRLRHSLGPQAPSTRFGGGFRAGLARLLHSLGSIARLLRSVALLRASVSRARSWPRLHAFEQRADALATADLVLCVAQARGT